MRFLISFLFAVCFLGCDAVENITSKIGGQKHDDQTAIYADVTGYWLCAQPSKSDLILPAAPKPDKPVQFMPPPIPEIPPVKILQSAPNPQPGEKIVCKDGVCTVQKSMIPPEIAKVTPSQQKNTTISQSIPVESANPCYATNQTAVTTFYYRTRPRGLFRR